MMIRRIIEIDQNKCNGCGICVLSCHESAIEIVDGKAKLVKDDYCDGIGDCLPTCPTEAISFVEREAATYDEEAVKQRQSNTGCLGTQTKLIEHDKDILNPYQNEFIQSRLSQWPIQIKLVPTVAPYFEGAHILIAADCTSYAYSNFHNQFMKDKITLIGCPKLDSVDYSNKLSEIIRNNNIKAITVVRMEVPCCGGIENAVKTAIRNSGKLVQLHVAVITTDGELKD